LKKSSISIFSPICFQLNREKNGKYNGSSKNQWRFLVRPGTVHSIVITQSLEEAKIGSPGVAKQKR